MSLFHCFEYHASFVTYTNTLFLIYQCVEGDSEGKI